MGVQRQFIRYAIVGLASNALAYGFYIVFTLFGLGPKLAMSVIYGISVLQTFIFNKRWTFGHRDAFGSAFIRYCISYGLGYVINMMVLIVMVDQYGYPHEIVQAATILSLAVMLFLLQKFWVFQSNDTQATPK